MEKQFWIDVWESGMIGFHRNEYHPKLVEHLKSFNLRDNPKTFVPLCGKTLDLLFLLSQGHKVNAIELCPIAVEQFFEENKITYKHEEILNFSHYKADELVFYCGDYFALNNKVLGDIDFVYDRASNIALPPDMRKLYYQKMAELTQSGTQFMILNLEHGKPEVGGPPFCVTENEIIEGYQSQFSCDAEVIDQWEEKMTIPRFTEKGVTKSRYKIIKINRH